MGFGTFFETIGVHTLLNEAMFTSSSNGACEHLGVHSFLNEAMFTHNRESNPGLCVVHSLLNEAMFNLLCPFMNGG